MADLILVANVKIPIADNITALYTSPPAGFGTLITAFTASNNSDASASYKAYIYDAAGAAVDPVIPQTIVVKDRFSSGAAIVNQVVPPGGTIRAENSTADALNFYVTGREQ